MNMPLYTTVRAEREQAYRSSSAKPSAAAARSRDLRATYSFRSRSSPARPPAATSTCSTPGIEERAVSPRQPGRTGTSRHPSTETPSAPITRSTSSFARPRAGASRGRKSMPTPYVPAAGQRDAEPLRLRLEEPVRHLAEDARAVAGQLVAAHGPAVHEVLQHGDAVGHDAVRAAPVDVDEEPDAAGVVLEGGVVESCRPALPARVGRFDACSFAHVGSPPRAARLGYVFIVCIFIQ